MPFVATINIPGYLPMEDEPPHFDTAQEAWQYLVEERKRGEDDTEGETYSETVTKMQKWAETDLVCDFEKATTIYGPTPGSESEHDLGLAYTVTEVSEEDLYPGPLGEPLECGCRPHVTRMNDRSGGLYCETEQQGYCNFECPHQDEE